MMSSDSQNRDQICNTELFIWRSLPVIMTSRVPVRVPFFFVQLKLKLQMQLKFYCNEIKRQRFFFRNQNFSIFEFYYLVCEKHDTG